MASDTESASLMNFLPTAMLRRCAYGLVILPPLAYSALHSQLERFALTPLEMTLGCLLGGAAVVVFLLAVMVVEACLLLFKTRETRTFSKWSNQHPLMTWRWLLQNAEDKHIFALLLLSLGLLGIGAASTLAGS